MKLNIKKIYEHQQKLENHSLLTTNVIQSVKDLRIFMESHVFAVWDFMCLLKTLQNDIVPSSQLWVPTHKSRNEIAGLINRIVTCEESDIGYDNCGTTSHYDLYLQAMLEVGANTTPIGSFVSYAAQEVKGYPGQFLTCDFSESFDYVKMVNPIGSKFTKSTFDTIKAGILPTAASFTFGRETIIPKMFRRILSQLNITKIDAPKFHYYLDRHIDVDENEHGPASLEIVEYYCKTPMDYHKAEQAAISAINARIELFNDIENKILGS